MRLKWKTWTALGAGCLLLGVVFFFRHSQHPPVPLKVFRVTTGTGLYGAMTLLSDGTLCVADHHKVCALDGAGHKRWSFSWPTHGDRLISGGNSLARLGDDTVVSVFCDRRLASCGLVALRDGKPLWERIVSPNLFDITMSQARSNRVILLAADLALFALDDRGEELWRQTTSMEQHSSPVENVLGELLHYDRDGTNGTVVLRSAEDGHELRRIGPDEWLHTADPDPDFYVPGNVQNAIAALALNIAERGSLARTTRALCTPAIAPDGTIYLIARVRNSDPVLLAVHPGGRLLWSFGLSWGWVAAAPVIGRDGTIYLVTGDRWVRAINPDGTLKWSHRIPAKLSPRKPLRLKFFWTYLTGEVRRRFGLRENQSFGQPVLSPDGRLFVSFNHTGSIYVFDTAKVRSN